MNREILSSCMMLLIKDILSTIQIMNYHVGVGPMQSATWSFISLGESSMELIRVSQGSTIKSYRQLRINNI